MSNSMSVKFIHGDCRPEFGDMFGGFLARGELGTFLIDCGVGGGAESLVRRLKAELGGESLDYLLLTHIHMDHAGAASHILRLWPSVKIVAHAKGLPHLLAPDRLWVGTVKVMGELADMYGRLEPLPASNLIAHDQAAIAGLKIIETPGHAAHHLSFRLGDIIFAGEAAGCPYLYRGRLYGRPATPPRYVPEITLASIDRLLEEPDGPAYCGHTHECLSLHECLKLNRRQLAFWDSVFREPQAAPRPGESVSEHLERLTDLIFKRDENLWPLKELDEVGRWRERYFMRNSVAGFLDYYASQDGRAL